MESDQNQDAGGHVGVSSILFSSPFDERKVLMYLKHLIETRFVELKPTECFSLALEILGYEPIVRMVKDLCSEVAEKEHFGRWIEEHELTKHMPRKLLITVLREGVRPFLATTLEQALPDETSDLEARLAGLKTAFTLTREELEVLTFRYLLTACQVMRDYLFSDHMIADFARTNLFARHGHVLLGIPRGAFLQAVSSDRLVRANLFSHNSEFFSLTNWCDIYLSPLSTPDLEAEFYLRDNADALSLSEFDLPPEDLKMLDAVFRDGSGHNVLLYGEPGTGKTSLARSLAQAYGKDLYRVKVPDTPDGSRIQALYATLNATKQGTSVVLVDEADDILNTVNTVEFRSITTKGWLNNLLETHHHTIIWVSNRVQEIDASTMRRFSYSVEFKSFSSKQRMKVMTREIERRGLTKRLGAIEVAEVCHRYRVNADGIVKALDMAARTGTADTETLLGVVNASLSNHEKTTGGGRRTNDTSVDLRGYSLEGLHASTDLSRLVETVKRYLAMRGKTAGPAQTMSLLLHGLPGTGKTAFVYYLSHALNKEVALRRSSDIMSMWLGATERNIAAAFREASACDQILFFDEADSFLFPRRDAVHSWEKTFTNEILTQTETYRGVVVFATNEIEGLDHAALRRFQFKVEFKPLTPEGCLRIYDALLRPLVAEGNDLSEGQRGKICSLRNLTPGDFALVQRQFLFEEPSRVTHAALVRALADEADCKLFQRRRIGFVTRGSTG